MAARLEAMGVDKYRGLTRKSGGRAVWTGNIRCDETALRAPRAWQKPKMVFVNSMSDLFHPDVPIEFIRQVWDVMADTPRHTYQVLTKRPERMAAVLNGFDVLPNVWLGTSVEGPAVLSRLDALRQVLAAVRFVSFEPLLASVAGANLAGVHWAIVGGESGPRSRPIAEEWVAEIKALCTASKTAFFFKQWGGPNKARAGRRYRGRTWDEIPDLRM
jgi:protein gp37